MQPLPSLPGWPIHLNLQLPTATRPDSHISISKAPVPTSCTHPLLPAHSLTSVCPQAGSWQAAFGTAVPSCLRRCWREQHPVSPNEPYLCLRLRKEFRLEFLLPHCQVLACHTAPSHLVLSACQLGGHLQRQSCPSWGTKHGQSMLHPCGLRAWVSPDDGQ